MNDPINPTLPLAFDLAWTATVLAWVLLAGVACASILRTEHPRRATKVWWCLFVLAVPFFGALLWFWAGPRFNRGEMRCGYTHRMDVGLVLDIAVDRR